MQTANAQKTRGTKAARAGRAPRKRISTKPRAVAKAQAAQAARERGRALLAKAFRKVHSPRARVAARALAIINATCARIAGGERARYESKGRAFPCAVFDYAEEVRAGMFQAIARGEVEARAIVKCGCQTGNAHLRKMSRETATAPQEIPAYLPQFSAVSDAPCHWQRAAIAKRARVLRARAFAEAARRRAEGGRGAEIAARRGLRSDLKWIRRATRYMIAQIDGQGFSLSIARGVSPAGRCGGKSGPERSQWSAMLRSYRHSAARLRLPLAL